MKVGVDRSREFDGVVCAGLVVWLALMYALPAPFLTSHYGVSQRAY